MPHSGPHFSIFWRVLIPKCSILGPPCRPAASQNGAQNRQVASKSMKKLVRGETRGIDLLSRSLLERSWVSFWSIWDGFWMNFDGFWYNLSMHFGFFCNKICRLPTSPDTKRIGSKHQEHADICRNMQDSDANKKRRHQIFHRWFAIYGMQSAAPSADRQKWGGRR